MSDGPIIPKRIQIETIFGCNASCVMCPVDDPTSRRKGVMDLDLFKQVVDSVAPYRDRLEKTDLFGIGEPLLDKGIFDKIAYAKSKGLPSIAISTNADLLTEDKARRLLEVGIDVVIFSIDGIRKETHEGIRVGVNFERVVGHVEAMIALRNDLDHPCRFVVRFIRQDANREQWESFRDYWSARVAPERGDLVIGYDVQSWGGKIGVSETVKLPEVPPEVPCHHLWDRLIVLRDGTVPLCCADVHEPELDLGNARDGGPITVYNAAKFSAIRKMHLEGRRNDLRVCRNCTILESEMAQQVIR